MIGVFLGPTQVAFYNAATKTSYLTSFVYNAAESIGAPMIASLYTKGDRPELQKLMTTMANLIFWPTVLLTLFIIVFGDYILWVFSPEFVAARWSLVILLLGQLVNAATGPVGYMLDLTGHQDKSLRVRLCTASLNILLCYLLIPKLGITGAAIATATSISLDNIVIYFLAVKYIGVDASIFSAFKLIRKNNQNYS
jgi:O-antigen/teichoic acid export membrane protein